MSPALEDAAFGRRARALERINPLLEEVGRYRDALVRRPDAARSVSDLALIAARVVPAAIELIDEASLRAAAAYSGRTFAGPALLIVECDGSAPGVADEIARVDAACRSAGALDVSRAANEDERAALWHVRRQVSLALRATGLGADEPLAVALVEAHRWAFLLGPGLIPAINALCLAPALLRGQLMPRAIPIVGLVGIPLLAASATIAAIAGTCTRSGQVQTGRSDDRELPDCQTYQP